MRTPTDMAQYKRLHSANEAYVYALERDLYSAPTVRRDEPLTLSDTAKMWLTTICLCVLVVAAFFVMGGGAGL